MSIFVYLSVSVYYSSLPCIYPSIYLYVYLSIYLSSPGDEDQPRGGRRDSLSPDSAAEETGSRKGRRDSNFGANSDKVNNCTE